MEIHRELTELLAAFESYAVDYLVIGGHAVSFHARPRFTKDLDIWYRGTPENRAKLIDALTVWGAAESVIDALRVVRPNEFVFLGVEPLRVDFLQQIAGVSFDECYARRCDAVVGGVPIKVISAEDLIANKRAVGRDTDLRDVRAIERARARKR